jgi:cytochrome oxidase Cu insertion factor (SCO1/SenC/PrrC family)
MRRLIVLIRVLLACGIYALAGDGLPGGDAHTITIRIHRDDRQVKDKITVNYYRRYTLFGIPVAQDSHEVLSSCEVRQAVRLGYLQLNFPSPYDTSSLSSLLMLAGGGDQLDVSMHKGRIVIGGSNAALYNLQAKLRQLQPEYPAMKIVNAGVLRQLTDRIQLAVRGRWALLDAARAQLTEEQYRVLRVNASSELWLGMFNNMLALIRAGDTAARRWALEVLPAWEPADVDEAVAVASCNYSDMLFRREMCLALVRMDSPAGGQFHALWRTLNARYSGALRDMLLLTALRANVVFRDSTDAYLDSALAVVKDAYVTGRLRTIKNSLGRGVNAYNFRLQDTAGRYMQLSDFRGKAVVVDFYFTGCSACITLNKLMDSFHHHLAGDTNVVFVSINVDRTMAMFRKAVRSGLYTHEGQINLFTNGEGMQQAVVKYYQIVGCPRMMVIDARGRMYEGSPPWPSTEGSSDKLAAVIRAAKG